MATPPTRWRPRVPAVAPVAPVAPGVWQPRAAAVPAASQGYLYAPPPPTSATEWLMLRDAGVLKRPGQGQTAPRGFGDAVSNTIDQVQSGSDSIQKLVEWAQKMGGDPWWKEVINGPAGQNIFAGIGKLIADLPTQVMQMKVIEAVKSLVVEMKGANLPPDAMGSLVATMMQMQGQPGMAPNPTPGADAAAASSGVPPQQQQLFDLNPEAKAQLAGLGASIQELKQASQAQQKQTQQVAEMLNATAQAVVKLQQKPAVPTAPPAPATPPAAAPPVTTPLGTPNVPTTPKIEYPLVCSRCPPGSPAQKIFARTADEAVQNLVLFHFQGAHPEKFVALQQRAAAVMVRFNQGEIAEAESVRQVAEIMATVIASSQLLGGGGGQSGEGRQQPGGEVVPSPATDIKGSPAPALVVPEQQQEATMAANGGAPQAPPSSKSGAPRSPKKNRRGRPRKKKEAKP